MLYIPTARAGDLVHAILVTLLSFLQLVRDLNKIFANEVKKQSITVQEADQCDIGVIVFLRGMGKTDAFHLTRFVEDVLFPGRHGKLINVYYYNNREDIEIAVILPDTRNLQDLVSSLNGVHCCCIECGQNNQSNGVYCFCLLIVS